MVEFCLDARLILIVHDEQSDMVGWKSRVEAVKVSGKCRLRQERNSSSSWMDIIVVIESCLDEAD